MTYQTAPDQQANEPHVGGVAQRLNWLRAGVLGAGCDRHAGSHTVIGTGIVGDEPAGMGIREDESPVTKNTSRFLPHYFI